MPRPRTKPPEERRDELMKAARRLFLEQGVGATTIEQITSRADVAKGTFYLYFSSKEQVLAALGDRYGGEPLVKIKAAIADTPEGIGRESWRHGHGLPSPPTSTPFGCTTFSFMGHALPHGRRTSITSSSIIFSICSRPARRREHGRRTTLDAPRSSCLAASTARSMTLIPRKSESTEVDWRIDWNGSFFALSDYRYDESS